MGRGLLTALAVAAAVAGMAGCGSADPTDGSDGGPTEATSTAGPATTPVEVGQPLQLPGEDGVRVTVTGFSIAEGSPGPRLVAEVTLEAPNARGTVPNAFLLCAGSKKAGGWQPESSILLGAPMEQGAHREARIDLLPPGGKRDTTPFPECHRPAVVAFGSPVRRLRSLPQVRVPDDTVDDLEQAIWRANDAS